MRHDPLFFCSNISLCFLMKKELGNALMTALDAIEVMPEFFRSYIRCSSAATQ
jgi:hypothetical protein